MKMNDAEKIKQLAREEAKHLMDVASATATALQTSTAKDIAQIQESIKAINEKLDGKYATKEELENIVAQYVLFAKDHESRMRWVESMIKYGLGAISVIQFGIIIYLTIKR